MGEWLDYLRGLNYASICVRILLAVLCTAIIGMERGVKGRAAGFRTHILVAVGACLTMMTGQYITQELGVSADPARLGAQVISGIGFLGVGTIIITRNHRVRGLTTAAGLWTSACLGLAIGIGFYEAAVIGSVAVTFAIIALQKVDHYFYGKRYIREYYIETEGVSCVRRIIQKIKNSDYKIIETMMEHEKGTTASNIALIIKVKLEKGQDPEAFLVTVGEEKGVLFVEEL